MTPEPMRSGWPDALRMFRPVLPYRRLEHATALFLAQAGFAFEPDRRGHQTHPLTSLTVEIFDVP